jgi:hypothetical protein
MTAYGERALRSEADRLRFETATGSRHNSLIRSAFKMGQLVGGGELDGERAFGVLLDAGLALGLARGDVIRTVNRGLDAGRREPRRASPNPKMLRSKVDAVLVALDLWDDMVQFPWQGASGARDLKLLTAFVMRSMAIGKVQFTYSVRQWAEDAGVSRALVSKRAMHLQPWIRRIQQGKTAFGQPAEWKLGIAPKRENVDSRAYPDQVASAMSTISRFVGPGACEDPAADLYHGRPGLWRVCCLLDPDGPDFTVKALQEATGLHPSTIRSYLHQLAQWGVVERLDRTTWRALDAPVNAEVIELTPAYAATRKASHAAERAQFYEPMVDLETGEMFTAVAWSGLRVPRDPPRTPADGGPTLAAPATSTRD